MTHPQAIQGLIAQTKALLREKLGVRASDMARAVAKAKRRLPGGVYKQALLLAKAEPLAAHPKLRLTLDAATLATAAGDVQQYLNAIDLADRRKGWILGMLGGLAFNMVLFLVLLVALLYWRGFF
ncbi:MAG: hypothetical protein JKY94_14950 [Rhodobacteraceae bacterium]|nr:hypothetical protein [Paracoccaceae bacterium]